MHSPEDLVAQSLFARLPEAEKRCQRLNVWRASCDNITVWPVVTRDLKSELWVAFEELGQMLACCHVALNQVGLYRHHRPWVIAPKPLDDVRPTFLTVSIFRIE